MDDKTTQILELLKWHTAEDLKRVQTKFTKTANAIKNEAINSRLSVLYTAEELEMLNNAAVILSKTKNKIERAKDVKKKEEERQRLLDEEYAKKRLLIIDKHIDLDTMPADEVLIMYCCLQPVYNTEKYLSEDIEGLFKYPDRYRHTINEWRRDIKSKLDHQFAWREEPAEEIVINFLREYQLKDRKITHDAYKDIIDRFNTFVAVKNGSNVELLKK